MKEILELLMDTGSDVTHNISTIIKTKESGSSSANLQEIVKKDIARLIEIVNI